MSLRLARRPRSDRTIRSTGPRRRRTRTALRDFFSTALGESEVEFSDETFLLTADEVGKRTEPPRLARVELNQANVQLNPGGATTFTISCYDQHGQSYPCPDVEWSAQGGAIDRTGRYIAEGAGTHMVRAIA